MNETTILLSSGDPKAKPDFLATVEPVTAIPNSNNHRPPFTLPFELVLDGYTREPWSSGRNNSSSNNNSDSDGEWQSCYFVSTDGRNRLPGFIQYLQGRKKAAIAKFDNSASSTSGKAMLVVPYDPPPIHIDTLPPGIDKNQILYVMYLRDENILKGGGANDNAKKKIEEEKRKKIEQHQQQHEKKQQQLQMQKKQGIQQQQQQQAKKPSQPIPSISSTKKSGGGGSGLLGNLLGKQRKTENHLDMVRGAQKSNDMTTFDPNSGAAGCINAFRTKVSTELEQFKADSTTFITQVSISLASLIKAVPTDEQDKVTMDVFKFTVYETVEEIGMDRWIAHKEPTEFMDECKINIYKEGHCPSDVLQDINQGELPDEIRGATRHIVESQSKAIQRKGKKVADELHKNNMVGEDNVVTVLNANKRDRRTLEQIQKDLEAESNDVKRSRFD